MPYADPDAQAAYQREWIARRRSDWFADKCCARCGSTDGLELDHEDPRKKITHRIWSWSQARRDAELAKCRVLCGDHHREKSATEKLRGEQKAGQAKLTEQQVREIRASPESVRAAARRFGVSPTVVSHIRRRVDWAHVT